MAHPYHHSVSSAKLFGGQFFDYIDIHSWFDSTKSHYANFRHRALRHHAEGIAWCCAEFGKEIRNSDYQNVDVEAIARQHIEEDCEQVVSIADWLGPMKKPVWYDPKLLPSQDDCYLRLIKKFSISRDEDHRLRNLVEFFYPTEIQTTLHWPAMRSHSLGIFEAERTFGEVLVTSTHRAVPTRMAAEEIVRTQLQQRIPSVQDWLSHIRPEPWMIRTKKVSSTTIV